MLPHIVIVGSPTLQNRFLARSIEKAAGFRCSCGLDLADKYETPPQLLLWDIRTNEDIEPWWSPDRPHPEVPLALFNVERQSGAEREAVTYGVRGVFYTDTSPELLIRGIRVILQGDLWFSRQVLVEIVKEERGARSEEMPNESLPALSRREREILAMIAEGKRNHEIAETLFISRNTVKSHVNHIYAKINATNRVEAVLWASRHQAAPPASIKEPYGTALKKASEQIGNGKDPKGPSARSRKPAR